MFSTLMNKVTTSLMDYKHDKYRGRHHAVKAWVHMVFYRAACRPDNEVRLSNITTVSLLLICHCVDYTTTDCSFIQQLDMCCFAQDFVRQQGVCWEPGHCVTKEDGS